MSSRTARALSSAASVCASPGALAFASGCVFTAFFNGAFFANAATSYPPAQGNFGFLLSLCALVTGLSSLTLAVVCNRFTVKPLLMLLFPIAALCAYFMDSYNTVIDSDMIANTLQTNISEARDLMSGKLLLYMVSLGAIPAGIIYRMPLAAMSYRAEFFCSVKSVLLSIGIMVLAIAPFSAQYASFFREHKILRYYANPVSPLFSTVRYFDKHRITGSDPARNPLGEDARIPAADTDRELVILVVGETARADRFSLNGYARKTNPGLERYQSLVSFSNMQSCATSTAISVPCMFALRDDDSVDIEKFGRTENLLDVLTHAGVSVLWRDNNSDSKGVARNVRSENFRSAKLNPTCDGECRDSGMLAGLDEYITGINQGDILIVLHQMGNHGPAYYKRYPESFNIFTPTCNSNQLEDCTVEAINNSYDNAILYTDYFLTRVIALLQSYNDRFETALFYVSDHGESLGEHGLYLHGLPNMIAPREQREVAALMWFGKNFEINLDEVTAHAADTYTHANLFHTVLGLFEVQTSVYNDKLDILRSALR